MSTPRFTTQGNLFNNPGSLSHLDGRSTYGYGSLGNNFSGLPGTTASTTGSLLGSGFGSSVTPAFGGNTISSYGVGSGNALAGGVGGVGVSYGSGNSLATSFGTGTGFTNSPASFSSLGGAGSSLTTGGLGLGVGSAFGGNTGLGVGSSYGVSQAGLGVGSSYGVGNSGLGVGSSYGVSQAGLGVGSAFGVGGPVGSSVGIGSALGVGSLATGGSVGAIGSTHGVGNNVVLNGGSVGTAFGVGSTPLFGGHGIGSGVIGASSLNAPNVASSIASTGTIFTNPSVVGGASILGARPLDTYTTTAPVSNALALYSGTPQYSGYGYGYGYGYGVPSTFSSVATRYLEPSVSYTPNYSIPVGYSTQYIEPVRTIAAIPQATYIQPITLPVQEFTIKANLDDTDQKIKDWEERKLQWEREVQARELGLREWEQRLIIREKEIVTPVVKVDHDIEGERGRWQEERNKWELELRNFENQRRQWEEHRSRLEIQIRDNRGGNQQAMQEFEARRIQIEQGWGQRELQLKQWEERRAQWEITVKTWEANKAKWESEFQIRQKEFSEWETRRKTELGALGTCQKCGWQFGSSTTTTRISGGGGGGSTTTTTSKIKVKTIEEAKKFDERDGIIDGKYNGSIIEIEGIGVYQPDPALMGTKVAGGGSSASVTTGSSFTTTTHTSGTIPLPSTTTTSSVKVSDVNTAARVDALDGVLDGKLNGAPIEVKQ